MRSLREQTFIKSDIEDSSRDELPFIIDIGREASLIKEQVGTYLAWYTPGSTGSHLEADCTAMANGSKRVNDLVPIYRTKFAPRDVFIPLQKWECIVISIGTDSFIARLVDLTSNEPDEEAEFPIEEVSEGDRELIRPGAVFYWTIGYLDRTSGQRRRASSLKFRRLPAWTREEIEAAEEEAERLLHAFQ